jgi:hypothetical protein
VLTNYDVNPFVDGAAGDEHVLLRPAVTWYADRDVRGNVATPAALEQARRRRPDAVWFLAVPWPAPLSPAAGTAVRAAAVGEPLRLSEDPVVELFRLGG